MNKAELVEQISSKAGISRSDATGAVEALISTVKETLASGQDIAITGFGKFSVSDRAAREGRNPQTGQTMQIAASRVPKFSAGAQLKEAVKRKY